MLFSRDIGCQEEIAVYNRSVPVCAETSGLTWHLCSGHRLRGSFPCWGSGKGCALGKCSEEKREERVPALRSPTGRRSNHGGRTGRQRRGGGGARLSFSEPRGAGGGQQAASAGSPATDVKYGSAAARGLRRCRTAPHSPARRCRTPRHRLGLRQAAPRQPHGRGAPPQGRRTPTEGLGDGPPSPHAPLLPAARPPSCPPPPPLHFFCRRRSNLAAEPFPDTQAWVCDGDSDCEDNSDEENSFQKATTTTARAKPIDRAI
ncbi:PREDICTED: uncharacterized protein LOC106887869 [Calidris pugnax]|uniref:uncharacterized protein LOC106887869 n=1 Tax=Calidris pugnax TaxID=198806 RepID=UPI00071E0BED|nr:PREDICTED: uncharacterized protein LOC106887869 [Calidris pugnax]